jgi:MFS superfamily sulfate permease-like transporter
VEGRSAAGGALRRHDRRDHRHRPARRHRHRPGRRTFFLLLESYRNAYSYDLDESADHKQVRLTLAEEVTFLNKPRVAEALSQLPRGAVVTVDASRTRHFDHDVVELLHDFRETARAKGITYRTVGVPEPTVGGGGH